MKRCQVLLLLLPLLPSLATSNTVKGDVIINVSQVGNNVAMTGSGTINLTGMSILSSSSGSPGVRGFSPGSSHFLTIGALGNQAFDFYQVSSFTPNLGPGTSLSVANSGSGSRIGVISNSGSSPARILVPAGASGNFDVGTSTSTYLNKTIAGMGLAQGNYDWVLPNNSKMTVSISAVPEPGSAAIVGLGACLLVCRRRHRVTSNGQPS